VTQLRSNLHKLIDMAIANHLDAHVMGTSYLIDVSSASRHAYKLFFTGGYGFLILVTVLDQEGDKIYIFGFSRGANTARALAGMIQKVCTRYIISRPDATRSATGGPALRGELPTSSLRV
jgi:hypothetical protein